MVDTVGSDGWKASGKGTDIRGANALEAQGTSDQRRQLPKIGFRNLHKDFIKVMAHY